MVDLAVDFKSGTTPAAKDGGKETAPVVVASPTAVTGPEATKANLTTTFTLNAGDTAFTVAPEPRKTSIFLRQVVTPAYKLPDPKK